MSDQQQVEPITTLEDLFLSREFGRSRPHPVPVAEDLEDVFLSREFGRSRPQPESEKVASITPLLVAGPVLAGSADEGRPYPARNRAMAAVSGVAAAALVVAGIVAGSGHPKPTGISAQGSGSTQPHVSPVPAGPGSTGPALGIPSGGSTPAVSTVAATQGGSLVPVALLHSAAGGASSVVVEVPPGTTVTVVPVPAPSGSGSGASGSPPAPTGPGNPLQPVMTVVANVVTTVGDTVSTTSDGLGSSLPPAAPLTGVVGGLGGTVSGLGQTLDATVA